MFERNTKSPFHSLICDRLACAGRRVLLSLHKTVARCSVWYLAWVLLLTKNKVEFSCFRARGLSFGSIAGTAALVPAVD